MGGRLEFYRFETKPGEEAGAAWGNSRVRPIGFFLCARNWRLAPPIRTSRRC